MIRVLITMPNTVPGEIRILESVFERFDKIHLRKEDWSETETRTFLNSCSWELRQRLVLCNHLDLFHEFQTGGVHLKEHMRENTEDLNQYRKGTISTSFHDLDSLGKEIERFDYALFGPVFPSFSKPGYLPEYSNEEIGKFLVREDLRTPVIAIGGVEVSRESELENLGFSGTAVLTSFWGNHVE